MRFINFNFSRHNDFCFYYSSSLISRPRPLSSCINTLNDSVRLSVNVSNVFSKVIPIKIQAHIESQFEKPSIELASNKSLELPIKQNDLIERLTEKIKIDEVS